MTAPAIAIQNAFGHATASTSCSVRLEKLFIHKPALFRIILSLTLARLGYAKGQPFLPIFPDSDLDACSLEVGMLPVDRAQARA